jgi:hypothetical protein
MPMATEFPYLLFAGDRYYPSGGWLDLAGRFATVDEAQTRAGFIRSGRHQLEQDDFWWHVVDLNSGEIVARQPETESDGD